MKALVNDLKVRIKDPISTEELSDLLFQLGHENNIENNIIDIDITPNRGDCLSLLGILRDLKNFYEIDAKYETYEEILDSFNLNFINESIESCPNISFLKIDIDETTSDYKAYLESFFSELGNKKINFFTDISNYLSYELGQPTHCYDSQN
jgi:Phenylalanyl-tRNA synthetase beta subunit